MIVLLGARGFLATHTRLALHGQNTALVSRYQPTSSPLMDSEKWIDYSDFENEAGEEVLRNAKAVVYFLETAVEGPSQSSLGSEFDEVLSPLASFVERLARIGSSARIVFLSSGATIYGNSPEGETCRELSPLRPVSPYGLGKMCSEEFLKSLSETIDLDFAILRVATTVGRFERSTTQGLVPAALRATLSGRPLQIYGDGTAVSDYVCATDVGEAITAAALSPGVLNDTWNVGSGIGRSVLEVLSLVEKVTGLPIPYEMLPARPTDVDRVVLDTSQITSDLGWRPRQDIDQAIEEMWLYEY